MKNCQVSYDHTGTYLENVGHECYQIDDKDAQRPVMFEIIVKLGKYFVNLYECQKVYQWCYC